jgi:hypothetical protein
MPVTSTEPPSDPTAQPAAQPAALTIGVPTGVGSTTGTQPGDAHTASSAVTLPAVAGVPPVVIAPAAPGTSTTTVVYVNPAPAAPAPGAPAAPGSGASGPSGVGMLATAQFGAGAFHQGAFGAATNPAIGLPLASRKNASLLTAYALFFFFGWTGMHQVYLGKTLRGVSYIFTFSWLTLALWIDLFTLPSQVRRVNTERMLGLR